MIEIIDMECSAIFGESGLCRLGYSDISDAARCAAGLIEIGALSADFAAIKRSGGKLVVVFSDAAERRVVDAGREQGITFVTFLLKCPGHVYETWHYYDTVTGQLHSDPSVWWHSLEEAKLDTNPGATLLDVY